MTVRSPPQDRMMLVMHMKEMGMVQMPVKMTRLCGAFEINFLILSMILLTVGGRDDRYGFESKLMRRDAAGLVS